MFRTHIDSEILLFKEISINRNTNNNYIIIFSYWQIVIKSTSDFIDLSRSFFPSIAIQLLEKVTNILVLNSVEHFSRWSISCPRCLRNRCGNIHEICKSLRSGWLIHEKNSHQISACISLQCNVVYDFQLREYHMEDWIHHFHWPIWENRNFLGKNIPFANIDKLSVRQRNLLNDTLNNHFHHVYLMYLMAWNKMGSFSRDRSFEYIDWLKFCLSLEPNLCTKW